VEGKTVDFEPNFETGQCWGAFATLQRVSRYADRNNKILLPIGCSPPKSTRTQLIAIFVEYAKKHPEEWHVDFVDIALKAFRTAFPCNSE